MDGKKKVIISHPTGNENTRHAVMGLANNGLLYKFVTCVAIFRNSLMYILSSWSILKALRKREFDGRLCKYTVTFPLKELCRQLHGRFPMIKGYSVDDVYHDLDYKVSCLINKRHREVDAVYAYDEGAYTSFIIARELGVKCLFDLPIIHWRTYQRLLKTELINNPEWASIIGIYSDSDEKLARKDKELMMADAIFVASSFTKRSIIEDFPYKINAPIFTIPYGFPPVNYNRIYAPVEGRKLKFLYVGRLSQAKGLSYMFKAVEAFEDEIELTVIGYGDINRCEALKNALSHVNYLGSCSHDEVLRLMSVHDILIFPSLFEGFGMVVTEAMSQGTPVLTTNRTCGVDFIDHGYNGWIVEAANEEALKHAIYEIIEDKNNLDEIGRHAMETAAMRPWKKYEDELAESVEQFLNHK